MNQFRKEVFREEPKSVLCHLATLGLFPGGRGRREMESEADLLGLCVQHSWPDAALPCLMVHLRKL